MGIIGFLFGKKPQITFTRDGRVRHEHPEEKWKAWKNRFQQNPQLNWKRHSGTEGVPRFTKK